MTTPDNFGSLDLPLGEIAADEIMAASTADALYELYADAGVDPARTLTHDELRGAKARNWGSDVSKIYGSVVGGDMLEIVAASDWGSVSALDQAVVNATPGGSGYADAENVVHYCEPSAPFVVKSDVNVDEVIGLVKNIYRICEDL